MTTQYSVNNTPATGSVSVFIAMSTLILAGWTVKSSSDGTTYNSSGNQITSGSSGAGGLSNASAWFRIQAPLVGSQHRELTFQKTTTSSNALWRIKYSASSGFTGGSPGATQTPSASDEQIILGGGTDASPTFSALLGTDGSAHFSIMAGDISIGYSFYWFSCTVGSQTAINAAFIFDVLQPGSYNSLDTDPCVIYVSQSASAFTTSLGGAYAAKGLLGTTYSSLAPCSVNADAILVYPANQGSRSTQNIFTMKDDLLPVIWARDGAAATPNGTKGISSFMLLPSVNRVTLNTQTVFTTRDRIILGYYSFPWNGAKILQ